MKAGRTFAMRVQDREFYSAAVDYFAPQNQRAMSTHISVVSSYARVVMPLVRAHAQGRQLRVLELGAGTCIATVLFKREFPTAQFTCLDISLVRMQTLVRSAAERHGISAEGITLHEGDFTNVLPFDDGSFDIILFDAALHHSRNIWTTLEECYRLLAPDGAVVAMREAYLARLTSAHAMRRLRNTPEFAAGVAENAYLKEQYDYYFRAAGFAPKFYAVNPAGWALLAPLNGLVFSKWSIWAPKASTTRPRIATNSSE
jgi:ubiquinone/menaquinone biosynthesis C-methylase UbiE